MPTQVLVTGATGMIGSLLVEQLVDQGAEFTAMLRPGAPSDLFADQAGVTTVEGDFDDPASLDRALEGVNRAFLLTNSTERTEAQQIAFVQAAARQGVGHVVKLSQLAANQASPVRFLRYHAAVEQALEQSGVDWTFVRPNLILQAYLAFKTMIRQGVLQAPIGDAAVSMVDARDIAAVCAAALTGTGHAGQTYTVTGPAGVTHSELATQLEGIIGQPVAFDPIDAQSFVGALVAMGMPQWQAEGLAEDYAHYDRREASEVSDDVLRVTGVAPRRVQDFLRDHANAFTAA